MFGSLWRRAKKKKNLGVIEGSFETYNDILEVMKKIKKKALDVFDVIKAKTAACKDF